MPEIEFHRDVNLKGEFPKPYPASQNLPEWFKAMPAEKNDFHTLKRCPPFVEAMTAGYIIPAPGGARITRNEQDQLIADYESFHFISLHHANEYAGAPFQDYTVVKFANPWIIVTSPDVVCLITAPINRFEMPFQAITGVVETGYFYKPVSIPMISHMRRGDTYDLRSGAPMLHVIPFRRDDWSSRTGETDETLARNHRERLKANRQFYKDELWKKLRFM